jgi:hypothetical protein
MGLYAALDVSLESTSVCIIAGGRSERRFLTMTRMFCKATSVPSAQVERNQGWQLRDRAERPDVRGFDAGRRRRHGSGRADVDDRGRVMPPWLLGELPDQGRAAGVGRGPSYTLYG